MRHSKFKSSTSLVLSMALVTTPIYAQDVDILTCGDIPEFPCLSVDGTLIEDRTAFDRVQQEAETAAASAADAARAEQDRLAAEAEQQRLDAQAADAARAEQDRLAAEAEQQRLDAEAADATRAEQDRLAAEAEQQRRDTQAADAARAEQDRLTAEAEQQRLDAEAADFARSEQDRLAAEAVENAQAEQERLAAEAAAALATTDPAPVIEEIEEQAIVIEQAPVADAPVITEVAPILTEATTIDEQLARQPDTPVQTVEEAPVESAAALADLDTAVTAADVVIESEVLTIDDVRSSTEDFANRVNAEAAPIVADSNDRDGLSTFQKALLVGLGVAVVGSILRNGDQVVSNSGDRVVVQRGDNFVVLKDDDILLRQPGSQVETQTFNDGSTRTIITRDDGTRIITIRGADGTVQRRARVLADGTQIELFDDTIGSPPVIVSQLPPAPVFFAQDASRADIATLQQVLAARERAGFDRTFSLNQVRTIPEVRNLAPAVNLDTLTFASGSAAIDQTQTAGLTDLGLAISAIVANDPGQVFLVEGHTDAVGSAAFNLALSDRRAETVALSLTEFFGVPPENLITQGYGENFLNVPTLESERANRRVAIRNITSLLR